MSCNKRNLENLDTNIYSSSNVCCENDCNIRYIERLVPYCCYPPNPPQPPLTVPTASYAQFYNNSADGATYGAGENIAYPSTLYNTDTAGIINNDGLITLSGGETGRTYLLNYQVTGSAANEAVLGLAINGTVDPNSKIVPDSEVGTSNGSYIVNVPANTNSTVALRVVSGRIITSSPTVGSYFSVIRIA